jgi:hypothetical protein
MAILGFPRTLKTFVRRQFLKHIPFRRRKVARQRSGQRERMNESRDLVSGAGFGDGVSPQKETKAAESSKLNRLFT